VQELSNLWIFRGLEVLKNLLKIVQERPVRLLCSHHPLHIDVFAFDIYRARIELWEAVKGRFLANVVVGVGTAHLEIIRWQ
jgi:hypothetical protein